MHREASVYPAIGQRIRQLREAKGWSQTELGERMPNPVTHHCISYWEAGKRRPDLDQMGDVAWALGVSTPELFQTVWEDGIWL